MGLGKYLRDTLGLRHGSGYDTGHLRPYLVRL